MTSTDLSVRTVCTYGIYSFLTNCLLTCLAQMQHLMYWLHDGVATFCAYYNVL